MTHTEPDYPQPRLDSDNRPYIEAWRERGKLTLQHCGHCGVAIFYPRAMCPSCWSAELTWREASGYGTVVSFGLVHRPNHDSFNAEVPIILAEVALAEGPTMIARLLAEQVSTIRSGLMVELLSAVAARRYPLPTFRPKT